MKKSFEKPFCEIVHFGQPIITTSGCGCDVGGIEFPGCNENKCLSINTYCDCQTNTVDETAENCIGRE